MGNYQLILKMVNLPSSSIRQWGSFKVGLLKPFKTKMSCLKRVPRVSESEEGITASSAVCSDNWQMGKSDRIFLEMLIFLLSHRLSDFRLHARAEVEKKKKKRKRNTYCNVSLAKQSYQQQTGEAWKENLYQISGIMSVSSQTKPSYKCSPLRFCTSHYSCYSQKSATPCLIRSADEETLLCVFAKSLYSSCPCISKSFTQLLNQSIINPVLVGWALQVLRELSWYPWGWTERKPTIWGEETNSEIAFG